jgi:hypothetical protein
VKGLVEEFRGAAGEAALDPTWQLVNGVWALVLAWALLLCSFALRQARSWRFLRAPLRSFLADYGAPLVLLAVSGLSFAVSGGGGVPRRVRSPNTWQTSTWTVAAVSTTNSDGPVQFCVSSLGVGRGKCELADGG